MSFSTAAPIALGRSTAISMAMSPPREVPMTAARSRPFMVMKSSTSLSSIRME
jgi:hypothetical protein